MGLFISVFKKILHSYLVWLAGAILLGVGLCIIYSTRLDPELRFWKTAFVQKREWSRALDENDEPKVVFAGGSSCTFSVRPDILQQEGICAVNMGGHAGMGALFLTAYAFEELRPGDTLILALEPDLLNHAELEATKLGIQAADIMGDWDLAVAGKLTGRHLPLQKWVGAMRPGGRHIVTMGLKLVLGRPLYRYRTDELGDGGWAYTSYDKEKAQGAHSRVKDVELADGGIHLLRAIKEKCDAMGVRVAYAIPWVYTEADAVDENRAYFRALGTEISKIIPVLDDPYWGAVNEPSWFADTGLHLKPPAAEIRSRQLADLIQNWAVIYNPEVDSQ